MKNKSLERSTAARILVLFLLLGAVTAGGSCLLDAFFHVFHKSTAFDPSVLILRYRTAIHPKPAEQFVFLTLGFLVPVIAYCSLLPSLWLRSLSPGVLRVTGIAMPLLVSILFLLSFIGSDFLMWLDGGEVPKHTSLVLAYCLLASGICFTLSFAQPRWHLRMKLMATPAAWLVFVGLMLLDIFAWRIVGESSVTVGAQWWGSADAVFYTVGQVFAGKTVLADMPSQYGLFPEFMGLVFRVTGLSILNFTIACAFLQITSLTAVFIAVQKWVREPLLKIVFPIALLMLTYETVIWFSGTDERYFQYWPVRFFWPALSLWAFHEYGRRPTRGRAALVSLAGGIGTAWNTDTGLMIVVAFAAFLVGKWVMLAMKFREQSKCTRRHFVRVFGLHLLIFAASLAGTAAYLMAKSGHALHWSWFFEYQQVFYKMGFMMMPLPMWPDPWMAILGIYLMGLLIAVSSWTRNPVARAADLIFFLSFLGMGLFIYYQGRAHILNLFTVSWPALALSVIMADRVVRSVRAGILPRIYLSLPSAALALALFCCLPVAEHIGKLWKDAVLEYRTRGKSIDPVVADELAFIRAHSTRGETCLILSQRQGLYYTATGLVSPLTGPGYEELILQRDQDALVSQLSRLNVVGVFVGTGVYSKVDLDIDPLGLLKQYSVQAKNAKESMLYLRLRQ